VLVAGCDGGTSAADAGVEPRVAYCAIAEACGLIAPPGISVCASTREGPPVAMQQCIAAAGGDCAAARACMYDATHASLCAIGAHPMCDGDVALTCDPMTTTTSSLDCALSGEVCVLGPTAARCALGSCDHAAGESYCDGDIAVQSCARPFLSDAEDCAAEGATCVVEPPAPSDGGVATCRGRGARCFGPTCNGDVLLSCRDGHQAPGPCPDGEHCYPPSAAVDHPRCAIAPDCDPNTFFDRCDTDHGVLEYCRRGLVEHLDCRAFGYANCQSSPSSGCVATVIEDGGRTPITDAPLP
jgi:hypothetical protein